MAGYLEIGPIDARQALDEGDWIILDARDLQSYRNGHIAGALLVHDGLTESLIRRRKTPRPVLVYCYLGNTSRALAERLASVGYPTVRSLAGGYTAWQNTFSPEPS